MTFPRSKQLNVVSPEGILVDWRTNVVGISQSNFVLLFFRSFPKFFPFIPNIFPKFAISDHNMPERQNYTPSL